jgi:tetratricopeptide (TPR) repeat protein
MSASLYSPDGQVQKDAVIDVGADTLLLSGVDELARILLADRLSTDVWELPGLAVAGTQSFDALRHYLRGEEAMHHDDYRTATEEFRGAVLGDSLFALAWYRFSHAVSWLSADSMRVSQEAFETALRHSQNLPRATRRTIEAENLSRQGRHREGMELLELVLSENPENTLAWLMLGDGQYHHNPYSGEPSSAGRDALERALDLDPDLAEARLHIFRFMTRDGEYADAESLATRMNFHGYLQPADTVALRIMSAEDSLSRQLLLDEVDDIPATAFRLAWVFENPEIAEQLLNQASASQEAREGDCLTWRSAIWGLHEMAFARGRVRTALTPIRARGIEYRRQMQRLISLLVYYPFSETALRELRNLTSSASIHCSDSSTKPRSLRDFAGGVAAWRIGDSDILEKAIRSLDIASDSLMLDNLEMVFAGTLRALGLWSAGKADRALASLDSALVPITFSSHHQDFYAQSIPRFVRAEILFSEGRYEEAIKWYASVNDGPHLDNGFPLFPPATFRRAQCYDRLGDTSRAIELYTRSIEIWEVADEELQPMVTEARQSLDRLMGAAAREPS